MMINDDKDKVVIMVIKGILIMMITIKIIVIEILVLINIFIIIINSSIRSSSADDNLFLKKSSDHFLTMYLWKNTSCLF